MRYSGKIVPLPNEHEIAVIGVIVIKLPILLIKRVHLKNKVA